mgnify:CR=1 FL=1
MRLLHWFYIVMLLVLPFVHLGHKIMTESGGFISRYLPLIIVIFLVLGLIGYAKKTPILVRRLWRVSFWVFLEGAFFAIMYVGFMLSTFGSAVLLESVLLLLMIAVLAPAIVVLYQYSKVEQPFWSRSA